MVSCTVSVSRLNFSRTVFVSDRSSCALLRSTSKTVSAIFSVIGFTNGSTICGVDIEVPLLQFGHEMKNLSTAVCISKRSNHIPCPQCGHEVEYLLGKSFSNSYGLADTLYSSLGCAVGSCTYTSINLYLSPLGSISVSGSSRLIRSMRTIVRPPMIVS